MGRRSRRRRYLPRPGRNQIRAWEIWRVKVTTIHTWEDRVFAARDGTTRSRNRGCNQTSHIRSIPTGALASASRRARDSRRCSPDLQALARKSLLGALARELGLDLYKIDLSGHRQQIHRRNGKESRRNLSCGAIEQRDAVFR